MLSTISLRESRDALRTMIAAGLPPTGGPFDGWDPLNNPKDPLIIIDHGTRTFRALVAPFNSCILNGREAPGVCRRPPRDGQDYAYSHTGGDVGIIGRNMNHASAELSASAAAAHYADTGTATFIAHYYEDDEAIWAMGVLTASVTDDDIVQLEASALSGDWRWIEEERRLRMIASQCVSTPGFRKAYDRYDFAIAASATIDDHELSLITTWDTAAPADPVRGTVTDMTATTTATAPCSCQHPAGETPAEPAVTPDADAFAAAITAAVAERFATIEARIGELAASMTAATVVATTPPAAVTTPIMTPVHQASSSDDQIASLDERLTAIEEVVASMIADDAQLEAADWSAPMLALSTATPL